MQTIDIIDPGWDWFQFGIFMIIPALVGMTAIGWFIAARLQPSRYKVERMTATSGRILVGALITTFVTAMIAGLVGVFTYSDHKEDAQIAGLEKVGYTVTQILPLEDSDGVVVIGADADNEMFQGILTNQGGNKWSLIGAGK